MICGDLSGIDYQLEKIDLLLPCFKQEILKFSPTGMVPALVTESSIIHDSLSIMEYFNEVSDDSLYPDNKDLRAKSRSLCAEMHSGFLQLRNRFPFSLEPVEPVTHIGNETSNELSRIDGIFSQAALPFMFDQVGAVDAFYAVLAYRLNIYNINLSGMAGEYQNALIEWPLLLQAMERLRS